MTWRGRTSQRDRIFACLFYLVPLMITLPLGMFFFEMFPVLWMVFAPLVFLSTITGRIPFFGLIVFFGLYLGVVRNENLLHFLRFNAMQALLLSILVFIFQLLLSLLGITSSLNAFSSGVGISPIQVLQNCVFLGIYGASIYAIVRCIQGLYAEMPFVSEAAYTQTR